MKFLCPAGRMPEDVAYIYMYPKSLYVESRIKNRSLNTVENVSDDPRLVCAHASPLIGATLATHQHQGHLIFPSCETPPLFVFPAHRGRRRDLFAPRDIRLRLLVFTLLLLSLSRQAPWPDAYPGAEDAPPRACRELPPS